MRAVRKADSLASVESALDEVRCESDGDSTQCEVDAMVQLGDVYVLMVSEIDEGPEDARDDLWPFIR